MIHGWLDGVHTDHSVLLCYVRRFALEMSTLSDKRCIHSKRHLDPLPHIPNHQITNQSIDINNATPVLLLIVLYSLLYLCFHISLLYHFHSSIYLSVSIFILQSLSPSPSLFTITTCPLYVTIACDKK